MSKRLGGIIGRKDKTSSWLLFVVYLTSTDLLRTQAWLQDRRNQTNSNREHVRRKKSRESRQTLKLFAMQEHQTKGKKHGERLFSSFRFQ